MSARTPRPVLIVTPWYLPSVGGVAEVAERLRLGLRREGIATHVLVTQGNRGPELVDEERSVWHFHIPSTWFGSGTIKSLLGQLVRGPIALLRLARLIRAVEARNVIVLYPIGFSWPFLFLRRLLGIRLITSVHGNDLERIDQHPPPLRRLQRRVLAQSDAVIACAPHLADKAREIVGRADLSITVIPNGVDLDRFRPAPAEHSREGEGPRLLHISNFASKKRTPDIVTAFSRASLPPTTVLTMVGDGPERAPTEELARNLGLTSERVRFAGTQADVLPYFWNADAFVLASDSEGAPLVLLESMAAGVPWVSTPWGAAADLPSGECGLAVPIGDIEALGQALEQILRSQETRERMAQRCRQIAEERYSIDAYIRRHVALLE